MFEVRYPFPGDASRAKILLEYIRYGITLVKVIDTKKGELVFYIRSPKTLFMTDENGKDLNSRDMVMSFKRELQKLEGDDIKVILKRAPYKNEFDEWTSYEASQAYEEYKMFLSCKYDECELL